MEKDKQTIRQEMSQVADDQAQENPGNWLRPGVWVALVCADPIYYGQLVSITPGHYQLSDASWIPDTGRAHKFVEDPSSCTESEYLGDIAVERPVVAIYRVGKGGKIATK